MEIFDSRTAGISPQEEWHGPYEVVTGGDCRWHVTDNAGRLAVINPRGWPDRESAERSRAHVDTTRASREHARAIADQITGVVCELAGARDLDDMIEAASTSRALVLVEQYAEAPGRVVVPEEGEAYYLLEHEGWSGQYAWPGMDVHDPRGEPVDMVNYSDCSRGPFAGPPEPSEQPSAERLARDLAAWVAEHASEHR